MPKVKLHGIVQKKKKKKRFESHDRFTETIKHGFIKVMSENFEEVKITINSTLNRIQISKIRERFSF